MSERIVYVKFRNPCPVRVVNNSYLIEEDEELGGPLQLPIKLTILMEDDSESVSGVVIPAWLAEDRGLAYESYGNKTQNDSMTRDDWFMLGITMAMVFQGVSVSDAMWEARKAVNRFVRDNE